MEVLLIAIGLATIWFGTRLSEEVHAIALWISGAIALLWGVVLAPFELQIGFGLLSSLGLLRAQKLYRLH